MSETPRPTLAVIGGTGKLGASLAWRWARAGFDVRVGSRQREKALAAAEAIVARVPEARVEGLENAAAAAAGDIVVLTVPFASQIETIERIWEKVQGKIVVDTTVPLVPPKVSRVQLPAEGSAALRAQAALGPAVRLVSALHNVAAARLGENHAVDCDILVCGDDVEARGVVVGLVESIGLRAWHAGPLANAVVSEAMTSVLIFINRHYRIDGAGIRIVGEPKH